MLVCPWRKNPSVSIYLFLHPLPEVTPLHGCNGVQDILRWSFPMSSGPRTNTVKRPAIKRDQVWRIFKCHHFEICVTILWAKFNPLLLKKRNVIYDLIYQEVLYLNVMKNINKLHSILIIILFNCGGYIHVCIVSILSSSENPLFPFGKSTLSTLRLCGYGRTAPLLPHSICIHYNSGL